jgi:hypothetical protein
VRLGLHAGLELGLFSDLLMANLSLMQGIPAGYLACLILACLTRPALERVWGYPHLAILASVMAAMK